MHKVYVKVPVLLLAGCTSAKTISTTPATYQAATGAAPATAVASSSATKAGVGDTIDLNGATVGDVLAVTVVKVVDPDSSNDGFSTPPAGDHYVSVQFHLVKTGKGDYQDDPFTPPGSPCSRTS